MKPILVDWDYETDNPLKEMDAIMKEYETTFGRYPDESMAEVVARTKLKLFMWWGWHRDTIRETLVKHMEESNGTT